MASLSDPKRQPDPKELNRTELDRLMNGYRLVTAEILYHMPDHKDLLQSFLWQDYDLEPRYPQLTRFLDYWKSNLDGPLHSVRIATKRIITPAEFPYASYMVALH